MGLIRKTNDLLTPLGMVPALIDTVVDTALADVALVDAAVVAVDVASMKSMPRDSILWALTFAASAGPLFVRTSVTVTGWLGCGVRLLIRMLKDKSAPPGQRVSD